MAFERSGTRLGNLHAVASKGLCAVISDPRANLREAMEAILVAELVDNDCWENLVDLSRALGHEDLAVAFTEARTEQREHLRGVRLWLGASLSGEAAGKLAGSFAAHADERDRRLMVATADLETAPDAATGPDWPSPRQRRPNKTPKRSSRKGALGKGQRRAARSGRATHPPYEAGQQEHEPRHQIAPALAETAPFSSFASPIIFGPHAGEPVVGLASEHQKIGRRAAARTG